MLTEVLVPHKLVSFEKIPTTIYAAATDACAAVAGEIACLIRDKAKRGEAAVLGLATGATPKRVYAELIRMHQQEGLSFANVVAFNLDEYYNVAPDALQSYHHFMHENFFQHID